MTLLCVAKIELKNYYLNNGNISKSRLRICKWETRTYNNFLIPKFPDDKQEMITDWSIAERLQNILNIFWSLRHSGMRQDDRNIWRSRIFRHISRRKRQIEARLLWIDMLAGYWGFSMVLSVHVLRINQILTVFDLS